MKKKFAVHFICAVFILALAVLAVPARAEEGADELAKQLANPVAALISVPFQFNYDTDIGPTDDGERLTINLQPVVPFELNDEWNLISRTIIPIIDQKDIVAGAGHQSGLGDIAQTFFFSPRDSSSGLIWGVGPVFLIPTGTHELLGTEKWGIGPSAVALKQQGPWTYGALVNHIESYAGAGSRADISSTFLNPFLSRRFAGGWTLGTQLEHTFDHKNSQHTGQWSVFISKIIQIGEQTISVGVTPRYWYEDTAGSPEGFGIRVAVTFLFPR